MATKTITAVGNAQLDTAQKKFGTASGLFDGTGDYLTTPDDTAWAFGTGKFTIDFWVRFVSVGGNQSYFMVGQRDADNSFWGVGIYINGASSAIIFHSIESGTWKINWDAGVGTLSADTWYHIAVVRDGTTEATWHAFIDGVEKTKNLALGSYANGTLDSSSTLNVASASTSVVGLPHNGWLDEVRVVKGTAVWTSGFTPPSAPYVYTDATGTELLLHMNGTDASTTFLDHSASNDSTAYTMTASVVAFTLTGVASLLKIGIKLVAGVGAFTLTGINAITRFGIKMLGALGTFTLTGVDADLYFGKRIVAEVGTFVLTGIDAVVKSTRKIVGDVATFTLTGINSILFVGHTIVASVATFTLTGIDAIVRGARTMTGAVATFTLTGVAILFSRASKITAVTASFVLTGVDAILSAGRGFVASVGTFTLTGVNALFSRASKIFATTASFVLTGSAITILLNGVTRIWTAIVSKTAETFTATSKNNETWTAQDES